MSASVVSSLHPPVQKNVQPEIIRRSGNWHPSIWGDHFLKYKSESQELDAKMEKHVKALKEEVKSMLSDASDEIQFIDIIQRLGFSYHFETEISKMFEQMMKNNQEKEFKDNNDLYMVSLKFRLLRQEGYNISSDVFMKFTNKDGKFKSDLKTDVEGMLSLYEASHLRFHGEPILDEALDFTTAQLNSIPLSELSPFLASQVKHALKQPIWTGFPRVEARHFIADYQNHPSCNQVLLRFAKLDFNIVQEQHQKELSELTRWWMDWNIAPKLSFVRDRLVECYFMVLGVYFEPQYSLGRKILVKVFTLMGILDDTYDVYGTLEELEHFTEAIQRWDIKCLDEYPQLPDFMKYSYQILIQVYDEEIKKDMLSNGREQCIYNYLKEATKKQTRSYLEEAKWFNKNYLPTYEEYMQLALISAGFPVLIATIFCGMDIATEEAFVWASKYPKIVKAASTIARLGDDIVTHKEEQERGDVSSSVECYVRQFGVSEEETYDILRNKIVNSWKDINEEICEYRETNMRLLVARIHNLVCIMEVVYKHEDGFSASKGFMKDLITSTFVDPIPV